MKIHLKIIAVFHLIVGYAVLGLIFLAHFQFLSAYFNSEISVLESSSFLESHASFFKDYSFTPPEIFLSFLKIVLVLAFGHGLLLKKKWSWWLGIVIAALGLLLNTQGIFKNYENLIIWLEIALNLYVLWVLTSKEVREMFFETESAPE